MENKETVSIEIERPCEEKIKNFYSSLVNKMVVDFVVNDLDSKKLSEKYHIDVFSVKKIIRDHKFEKRKDEYQEKLFSIVLKKTQRRQAATIANVTKIINTQINRILKKQEAEPDYIVSGNQMKDLIAVLAILSKEYRLDHGQSTDNQVHKVVVEMPNNVPIISENHLKKDVVEVETVKEIIEEVKEEIKTEPKEEKVETKTEPTSNSDFFGPIL